MAIITGAKRSMDRLTTYFGRSIKSSFACKKIKEEGVEEGKERMR
jgi:hypothetical protein